MDPTKDQGKLLCRKKVKVWHRKSKNAFFSQLDALLETDSEDDYLVVDDQRGSCEITTNFKDDNKEDQDISDISTGPSIQDILVCPKTMQIPDLAPFHQATPKAIDSGIFSIFMYHNNITNC